MTKLHLDIELDLDFPVDQQDPEELAWFRDEVLGADPAGPGSLRLHSNEIGDTLGGVRVVSWWTADRLPETYEWTVPGGTSGVVTGFGDTNGGLVDFFVSHPRLDNIDICQELAAELLRLARRKGEAHESGRKALAKANALATENDRLRRLNEKLESFVNEKQRTIDSLLENGKLGAQAGLTVDQLIERVREWVIGNYGLDSFERQAETADFEEGLRSVFENELGDYLLPRDTMADKAAIAADICAPVLRDALALLEDALYEDRPGVWFVSYKEDAEVEGAAKTIGRLREVVASLPSAPPSTDSIWDWMRSDAPAWGQKPQEGRSAPAGGPDPAGASPEAGREGGGPQAGTGGLRVASRREVEDLVAAMETAGFTGNRFADPGFGRDAGSPLTKERLDPEGNAFSLPLSPDEAVVLFDILRHIGGDPVRSPRRHASSLAHKLWQLVGRTDPRPDGMPLPKDPSPDGPCLYYLDDLPPARIWGKEPAEPEEEPAAPLGDVEALRLKIEELEGFVYRMHRRLVHFESENAPF